MNQGPELPTMLRGWKEIADFMHCSISTARRLENDGLPIMRDPRNTAMMIPWQYYEWLIIYNGLVSEKPKDSIVKKPVDILDRVEEMFPKKEET